MTVTHAEVVAAASQINKSEIDVDVFKGPAGGNGFRKGTWTATYHGEHIQFFDSIPHGAEFDKQKRMLKNTAAFHIAAKALGY